MDLIKFHAHMVVDKVGEVHESVSSHLGKVDPLYLVIGAVGGTLVYMKLVRLYKKSEEPLIKRLSGYAFSQFRRIPHVKARIEKELSGARKDIMTTIHKDDTDRQFMLELPAEGLSSENVLALADKYEAYGKFAVSDGRVSGAVYTDLKESHIDLLTKIYRYYAYSNPLHPDVFPGARKMEAEVIRMVLSLYNGDAETCGSLTTGGTESIIMACYAYKNRANARGIETPVILCSLTAHAAFDKAAVLCGMKVRHVSTDEDYRVDLKKMERLIDGDVCMLVGSAPNYASGTIDPIPEIAALGLKYDIPVHVDACLGGFLVPFMNEAGFFLKPFDFRNKGVTSISCDTHKYGCTPKGSSIVMYRNKDLLHYQYFSVPDWSGGIYATPTITGSRAGANSAAAWATLLSFGREEYVRRCRTIVGNAKKIAEGVKKIPGLRLHGSSDVSVVAFTSDVMNIYAVSDKMTKLGWALNTLQNPNAVHICLTFNHADEKVVTKFLSDLNETAAEVMTSDDKGNSSHTAALYGMAAQIPDKTLVDEMTAAFLDACYAVPPPKEN